MGGGHFGNAREGLDASLEAAEPPNGNGSSGSSSSHGHMSLMASTSPGDGRLAKDSWRRSVPPTQDADYARAKEAALRQAERLRHEVRAAPEPSHCPTHLPNLAAARPVFPCLQLEMDGGEPAGSVHTTRGVSGHRGGGGARHGLAHGEAPQGGGTREPMRWWHARW